MTLFLVPITMHLPSSLQVSQSATQCLMTQTCSSTCNTPYDLQCLASYQPPPSYFYPTGKTRASMPTEHLCEITQITAPRLASSPRQNSHMQCQPRGRVSNLISPATPGAWILLLSGTTKQNSVYLMPHQIGCKHCKGVSQKQYGKTISTSQERTQTTLPTMFAPSTSNQKERTSLARKEAKTLTFTPNHGTISSLN